jgi:hypothetical protein
MLIEWTHPNVSYQVYAYKGTYGFDIVDERGEILDSQVGFQSAEEAEERAKSEVDFW